MKSSSVSENLNNPILLAYGSIKAKLSSPKAAGLIILYWNTEKFRYRGTIMVYMHNVMFFIFA